MSRARLALGALTKVARVMKPSEGVISRTTLVRSSGQDVASRKTPATLVEGHASTGPHPHNPKNSRTTIMPHLCGTRVVRALVGLCAPEVGAGLTYSGCTELLEMPGIPSWMILPGLNLLSG